MKSAWCCCFLVTCSACLGAGSQIGAVQGEICPWWSSLLGRCRGCLQCPGVRGGGSQWFFLQSLWPSVGLSCQLSSSLHCESGSEDVLYGGVRKSHSFCFQKFNAVNCLHNPWCSGGTVLQVENQVFLVFISKLLTPHHMEFLDFICLGRSSPPEMRSTYWCCPQFRCRSQWSGSRCSHMCKRSRVLGSGRRGSGDRAQ